MGGCVYVVISARVSESVGTMQAGPAHMFTMNPSAQLSSVQFSQPGPEPVTDSDRGLASSYQI